MIIGWLSCPRNNDIIGVCLHYQTYYHRRYVEPSNSYSINTVVAYFYIFSLSQNDWHVTAFS